MSEHSPSEPEIDVDDDEEPIEVGNLSSAFVTDTDWTTETILSQMRRGNIQLNPRFQRRDAWNSARKSRFIESLILGLPIPQLVLAEDKRKKGAFIVLDGKQRLLTLAQFAKDSSFDSDTADSFKSLKLSSLEIKSELARYNLKKLEESAQNLEELNGFLNQTIRTVVVRNWPDESFLNLVFLRLNTGSVALSPQELRQALHPGPFTDYLDDRASESKALQKALKISGPDFRMRDVEILLRFYAVHYNLEEYRGNLKKFLDDASDTLNADWNNRSGEIAGAADQFDAAILAGIEIFGDDAFRRWNSELDRWERPFNRAVFEAMVYYFSDPAIRDAALEKAAAVKSGFQELIASSPHFDDSLKTSTKTIEALHARLSEWGSTLARTLGFDFSIPELSDDRITRTS